MPTKCLNSFNIVSFSDDKDEVKVSNPDQIDTNDDDSKI